MNENRRILLQTGVAAGAAALAGVTSARAATEARTSDKTRVQALPTGMTFATIRTARGLSLGIRDDRQILDVAAAEARFKLGAPTTIDDVLHGRGDVSGLSRLLAKAKEGSAGKAFFMATSDARFGPCVTNPEKIVCIGLNYKAHAAEANAKPPPVPILFNKYNSALNHHGGEIAVSKERVAKNFDYEAELVIVMGKTTRDVSEQDASSAIAPATTSRRATCKWRAASGWQARPATAGDRWVRGS